MFELALLGRIIRCKRAHAFQATGRLFLGMAEGGGYTLAHERSDPTGL